MWMNFHYDLIRNNNKKIQQDFLIQNYFAIRVNFIRNFIIS